MIRARLRLTLLASALLCMLAASSGSALAAGSGKSSKSKTKQAAAPTTSVPAVTSNPFAVSTPTPITTQPVTTPAVTTTSTASSSGGLGSSGAIIIGVVAFGVLGAVGIYIARDARQNAPSGGSDSDPFGNSRNGSKAPKKSRKLSPTERKRRKRGRAK